MALARAEAQQHPAHARGYARSEAGSEVLCDGRFKEFVESRDVDSRFNSGEKTSTDFSGANLWQIRGKGAVRAVTYAPPQATAIVTAGRILLRPGGAAGSMVKETVRRASAAHKRLLCMRATRCSMRVGPLHAEAELPRQRNQQCHTRAKTTHRLMLRRSALHGNALPTVTAEYLGSRTGTEPRQRDPNEATDRSFGREASGGCEGVNAVRRELEGRRVAPDVASPCTLGQKKVLDDVAQLLLRANDVFTAM